MSAPTKVTEWGVEESVLPPGQRDRSGFWYPAGYNNPKALVRPRRRRRKEETAEAKNKAPDNPGH